jgi:leucyl-tRNA synthetase
MGYDSFGLPAEQYAIQTGQRPEIPCKYWWWIKKIKLQDIETIDQIGFSFDWDKKYVLQILIITNIRTMDFYSIVQLLVQ